MSSALLRTPETWEKILGELPSPEGASSEFLMAHRIIGDLIGYRHNSSHRADDALQLANALRAYGRMHFDAGVRP